MPQPRPIKIFLCYKKRLEKDEPGGKVVEQNTYAQTLAGILNSSSHGFVAWFDETIPGGVEWERMIYSKLLDSDVVLAVVGPGTSQSVWVKREITFARCFGISVYPLGVGVTEAELTSELTAMNINNIQGKISLNVKLNAGAALLAEISDQLKEAARRTLEEQQPILSRLQARHAVPPPRKAADVQQAASFVLPHPGGTLALHIAAGDIAQVRGIDVLVSSENDYMQLARFFESRTVSSTLRRLGAQRHEGRFDDTIQKEIDWRLKGRVRPLQLGECVFTSAGGPDSELVNVNGARYIVHVAAVETVIAEARVAPIREPDQIRGCIRGALLKIGEINGLKGVVSPPDSDARESQELAKDGYAPIRSVIFPLFGTGQGGADKDEVIEPMLIGLQDFLNQPKNRAGLDGLTDIYLSVYLESDVESVIDTLGKRFARLSQLG